MYPATANDVTATVTKINQNMYSNKQKQQLNNYNYGFQLNEHSHIQVHCEEGLKIESTTIQGCTNMIDNTNHPPPHWLIKGTIIWRNEKKKQGKRKN